MELRLKNNSNLSLGNPIQTNIINNCTGIYINNCPNISGINVLRQCTNLNRVRLNIGSVSGTLDEIQSYASLNGYNDDGENQLKPRIKGTYTITDYYTQAIISSLESAIDGITIETSQGALDLQDAFDNERFAVQTLDSTKANYNPAVAIKLQAAGYGTTMSTPIISGQGRWYMYKTEATNTAIGTMFSEVLSVTDTNGIVTSDTSASYNFESFDEFQFFRGNTSIPANSFKSCTNLTSIKIPPVITYIGDRAFYSCNSLTSIIIPTSVTNISNYAFSYCTGLTGTFTIPSSVTTLGRTQSIAHLTNITNINILPNITIYKEMFAYIGNAGTFSSVGTGLGNVIIKGDYICTAINAAGVKFVMQNMFVYGDYKDNAGVYPANTSEIARMRVNGTLLSTRNSTVAAGVFGEDVPIFVEAADMNIACSCIYRNQGSVPSKTRYLHLNRNSLPSSTSSLCGQYYFYKMFVGDGSSRQNDEDVLALYLADSDWSTRSNKLATWYDYNGEYKWYYVTDNLTGCINTNPDSWPHIYRNDSYTTTLVPEAGKTIDTNSVTVQMYETLDNPNSELGYPTPNSPNDITQDVYNPITNEINIPAVTGNVIITATAS